MATAARAVSVSTRKPVTSTPRWTANERTEGRYLKLPYGTIKTLYRRCTATTAYVCLRAMEETHRDEEATISEIALAREINVTDRAIREAFDELEAAQVISPRVRDGRRVRICRPRIENLIRMKERIARKLKPAEPEAEPVSRDTETPAPPKPVPAKVECPACNTTFETSLLKINGLFTNTGTGVPVSTGESPPGIYKDAAPDQVGEKSAKGGKKTKELRENTGTGVPVSFDAARAFDMWWTMYSTVKPNRREAALDWWFANVETEDHAREILKGTSAHLETKDWQEGIGIPYGITFLERHQYRDPVRVVPKSQNGKPDKFARLRELAESGD